ncbi:MAG: phosphopantetheine-binding protein [Planctomycetota bacterium]
MTAKQDAALDIIAALTKKDRATLLPKLELTADLGVDSPKGLELLMNLEEKLEIEISDDDAARMTTVGDILAFVENK